MYVVGRVFPLTGGLEIEEAEVVQVVGVGIQGGEEVARGRWILQQGFTSQNVLQPLAQHLFDAPARCAGDGTKRGHY